MGKIAVFMSGGIDSSLAAILLKEQGNDIIGITAKLLPCDREYSNKPCCTTESINDAKDIARKYDFKHITVDLVDYFKEKVIDNFYHNYMNGNTPNPCIKCNEFVKISALYKKAMEFGYPFFATGHYSDIKKDDSNNRYYLKSNIFSSKDQSYFLFSLSQEILSKLKLPLANYTKDKVRDLAKQKNLSIAKKQESQEICFVPNDNYKEFLSNFCNVKPTEGKIVDTAGKTIGIHKGFWNYTIGQRKGLGISFPKPHYVIKIEARTNTIIVGKNEHLYRREFQVKDINFVKMHTLPEGQDIMVKIRSTSKPQPCSVYTSNNSVISVKLFEPARAITPGQAAVFLNKEGDLLFGGWIE